MNSNGKQCKTIFERLNYNGKSSTVLCKPKTGRMHQIRVHLQYLGYPILNDNIYNSIAFGPNKGKGGVFGKSLEEVDSKCFFFIESNELIIIINIDLFLNVNIVTNTT